MNTPEIKIAEIESVRRFKDAKGVGVIFYGGIVNTQSPEQQCALFLTIRIMNDKMKFNEI
jgi:hypothetical protein